MIALGRIRVRISRPGATVRNIGRMVFGTASAQLIGVLVLIPLARLYSPEAFGFFALFQAVVSVGVSIASLRYDVAIVLPTDDDHARVLRRLSFWSICAVSILLAGGLVAAQGWMVTQYGSEDFARWMVAAAAAVFVSAQTSNIQYWLTRIQQFGVIASNRVLQALLVGMSQLVAYVVLPNVGGLIIGLVCGSLVTLSTLIHRTPSLRQPQGPGAPTKLEVAVRYKKMPLLNGPNALVDAVRTLGLNYLIGLIAVSDLGEYNMAWRLTMAPASLIQGAIAQVFLQKMSKAKPGQLVPLLKQLFSRIFVITAPLFAAYYAFAPWLFTTFLGDEWGQASQLARALMPWVFILTFTTPAANVFVVTEKQQWLLLFAIVYAACPLLWLVFANRDFIGVVSGLGWIMAALLMGMLAMTFVISRRYDQSDE